MSLWLLYLIEVLPNLRTVLIIIGLPLACGAAIFTLAGIYDEDPKYYKLGAKRLAPICLACWLIAALIPSTTGMYRIIGGYFVTDIEGIEKLPPAVVDAAEAWLKSVAKDAQKDE